MNKAGIIKNVVFDIGNVLIHYTPGKVLDSFGVDEETQKLLFKHVFASSIWDALDRGDYSLARAVEIISAEIPLYADYVARVFDKESLDLMFSEKTETVEFMRDLKRRGFKLYLLSNFSREGFEYVEEKFGFLSEVDGRVISSHVHAIKPDPEIYNILLTKYALVPAETVFIDDLRINCDGAEQAGMGAIQFTNIEEVKKEFAEVLNQE